MKFLYSNIPPLQMPAENQNIKNCIIENFEISDSVEIAVGYISEASLDELEILVEKYEINKICLIIGMYFFEGIPENSYNKLKKLNNKWKNENLGEIRIVTNFKYHGKIYSFSNENYNSVIVGSSNLSVIKPDASTLRQYESAIFTDDSEICKEIMSFINNLKEKVISSNISDVEVPIKQNNYNYLENIELVNKLSKNKLDIYQHDLTDICFKLPLKTPSDSELLSENPRYGKSNINVCYAAPRNANSSNPKPRNWFETQITVGSNIWGNENWPIDEFYIVTDDGYEFKAHTTGQNNKQLSPKGNELILGWWIKGRLINSGLISPQPNTLEDTEKKGMITTEILEEYGCTELSFIKTNKKEFDEEEESELDVWLLLFESN